MPQGISWTSADNTSCLPIWPKVRQSFCWSFAVVVLVDSGRKHYSSSSPGTFPVICEDGVQHIQIVKAYKHLGGWLHHRSDQRMEMAQKAAIAHAAFGRHRKILYGNKHLDLAKRTELFSILVLTKMLYGADTWTLDTKKDSTRFYSAVLKLYKRMIGWTPDMNLTDEWILVRLGLPTPQELLRRARLRYLAVLAACGLNDFWSILAQDRAWCRLLEDDMQWMWQQLRQSSNLKAPREHFPQWRMILTDHGRYWKRLVNRAFHHAALQRKRCHEVCALHQWIADLLGLESITKSPEPADNDGPYGCLACHKAFRSRAGEGAHMFKVHGLRSWSRQLFDEPSCPACLKYFHTMAKTKAHLYYSQSCRTRLLSQNMQCMPAAGTGSSEDRVREQLHDFFLPPLKGYGPHLPCSRRRDMVPIDDRLHLKLVDLVAEQTVVADFGEALQAHAEEHPISWTTWKATLHFFIDTFAEDDAIMFDYDIAELLAVLRGLASAEAWPFLRTLSSSRPTSTFRSVAECHEWCALTIADVSQLQPVPRQFGRHRYILHAFSGRRRIGDLQYFLERIVQHKQAYVVHVISLDIIVSSTWGDISQDHVRQFWLNAIRAQWVFAFIGGPPCETWSRVRAVGHESMPKSGRHVPRVLRDLRDLWGFESAGASRALQCANCNSSSSVIACSDSPSKRCSK